MTQARKRPPNEQEGQPKKAGRQFGKYKLIAHLATGGMAEIFLASQSSLAGFEKHIVIKRILANLAQEERFVHMFLDEARIAAMLNHPNVVTIFDLGVVEGRLFIAMEYLAGESLSKVIKSCRKRKIFVPPELAAGIILQAAEGLHHAHTLVGPDGQAMKIVHRDVSPQNVFALYDGGVKVVDFGIAKASNRNTKTSTGMLKGKYSYMSPEQVLSKELDARSDVFALGVILWELLTCRKLFNQDSDLNLLKAVIDVDAPSPAQINPGAPAALVRIALKALARKRQERYQSAAALRADLAAFLKTRPLPGDTVAISKFMHMLFADRMEKKRKLIEKAKSADLSVDDSLVMGHISKYLSDTEHSVLHGDAGRLRADHPSQFTTITMPRSVVFWIAVLGLPLLLLVAGLGFLGSQWLAKNSGAGGSDSGPGLVVGVADLADGGKDADAVIQAPDGGTRPDVRGRDLIDEKKDGGLDGAASIPRADQGKKKKKKKRRKQKKRRRKVVNKNPKKPSAVSARPGKLRLMTRPWTEIYYKGKKLGQTPLIDVKLPSGWVVLKAINKGKGINRTLRIKIPPGKTISKRINLLLGSS